MVDAPQKSFLGTSCRPSRFLFYASIAAQMPLFSYPVVHKCLVGGADRQTDSDSEEPMVAPIYILPTKLQ